MVNSMMVVANAAAYGSGVKRAKPLFSQLNNWDLQSFSLICDALLLKGSSSTRSDIWENECALKYGKINCMPCKKSMQLKGPREHDHLYNG